MSIRELFEHASHAVDTYKSPDISEARERLNEILIAAGLGSTGSDNITRWNMYRGEVEVGTRYSVRSCAQEDRYTFPQTILDAPDPIAAARKWGLERKRDKAAQELKEAETIFDSRKARLQKIRSELAQLPAARTTPAVSE